MKYSNEFKHFPYPCFRLSLVRYHLEIVLRLQEPFQSFNIYITLNSFSEICCPVPDIFRLPNLSFSAILKENKFSTYDVIKTNLAYFGGFCSSSIWTSLVPNWQLLCQSSWRDGLHWIVRYCEAARTPSKNPSSKTLNSEKSSKRIYYNLYYSRFGRVIL